MMNLVRRGRDYVRCHGLAYTLRRVAEKTDERVRRRYERVWQQMKPDAQELARERANPVEAGLISVVIPVYNTDPGMLRALAESLLDQTYPSWEACLYDDCSTRPETIAELAAVAGLDARFRTFRGEKNQGISGSSNAAVDQARGEWIALCDHDDLLTPDALYRVAEAIVQSQPDMIYSDEDKITEDGRYHTDPHFKPDFCPDNLRSGNYICHLMVLRKTLIHEAGGFRSAMNGSQDHDLALRCTEHTDRIVHIPRVLYHWRTVGGSVSHQNMMKCVQAACRAVQEHMERIGWPGTASPEGGYIRLRYDIKGTPTVDVFVLGKTREEALPCLRMLDADDWKAKRVVAVGASEEGRFAVMNQAAAASRADVLLFADASLTGAKAGLIREMLMYAQRDDVGAVTAELTDRRGRITHGGFAVGMEGAAQCREAGLPYHAGGWHLLMQTSHNVAAVSGACVMIRRDHFIPFDEAYHGGLGAVAWSLALGERGLRHVFTPHARAVCTDRALLLLDRERDEEDMARFTSRWQGTQDPCYSALFSRTKADYQLEASPSAGK